MTTNSEILKSLQGKLVVSCQALSDEPLHSSTIMGRMALAAKEGGAAAIRANTVADIVEIKKQIDLPVIGIIKADYADSDIYITPTMREVDELSHSPAEIIAMDATPRRRPGNVSLHTLVEGVRRAGKLAMADISSIEEGIQAEKMGFDLVSTTLSGYTPYTQGRGKPDFDLITELKVKIHLPVVAEGNVSTPEELVECFHRGAFFVVIGGAITRPQLITRAFVDAIAGNT